VQITHPEVDHEPLGARREVARVAGKWTPHGVGVAMGVVFLPGEARAAPRFFDRHTEVVSVPRAQCDLVPGDV